MNSFSSDEGPGYVYVVRWGDNLYKIGITKNIEQRFQQIKVGEKLEPIWWGFFEERRAVESEMHKALDRYRLPQSEYFELKDRGLIDSVLADLKSRTFEAAGDRYKALIPDEFQPGYVQPQAQEEPEPEPEELPEWSPEEVVTEPVQFIEPEPEPEPEPVAPSFEERLQQRAAEILAARRQEKTKTEPPKEVELSWVEKLAAQWRETTKAKPQLRRQRTMSYGEWFCSRKDDQTGYDSAASREAYQRYLRLMQLGEE